MKRRTTIFAITAITGLLGCSDTLSGLDGAAITVTGGDAYTISHSGEAHIEKTIEGHDLRLGFRSVEDFERATAAGDFEIAVADLYDNLYIAADEGLVRTDRRIEELARESTRTICGNFVTVSLVERNGVDIAIKFRYRGVLESGHNAAGRKAKCKERLILHEDVNGDCDDWAWGGCGGAGDGDGCTNSWTIVEEDCSRRDLPVPEEPNGTCTEVEIFGPNLCQCR